MRQGVRGRGRVGVRVGVGVLVLVRVRVGVRGGAARLRDEAVLHVAMEGGEEVLEAGETLAALPAHHLVRLRVKVGVGVGVGVRVRVRVRARPRARPRVRVSTWPPMSAVSPPRVIRRTSSSFRSIWRTWTGLGLGLGLGLRLRLRLRARARARVGARVRARARARVLGYLLGGDGDLPLHLVVEGVGRPHRPRLIHVALAHLVRVRVRVGVRVRPRLVHVSLTHPRLLRVRVGRQRELDTPPLALDVAGAQRCVREPLPGGWLCVSTRRGPPRGEVERVVWPNVGLPQDTEDRPEKLEEAPRGHLAGGGGGSWNSG
eukprot:scaffold133314_cov94-Phaeocystis_antarctica.AAC.4